MESLRKAVISLENTDTQIRIGRCAKVFPLHTVFIYLRICSIHDFFVK